MVWWKSANEENPIRLNLVSGTHNFLFLRLPSPSFQPFPSHLSPLPKHHTESKRSNERSRWTRTLSNSQPHSHKHFLPSLTSPLRHLLLNLYWILLHPFFNGECLFVRIPDSPKRTLPIIELLAKDDHSASASPISLRLFERAEWEDVHF